MSKSNRHITAAQHGNRSVVQQHETTDDSFLPSPEELKKYQEVDPNCVDWLKDRAVIEQEARIDWNKRRMSVVEKTAKRSHHIDLTKILAAFIIVTSGMAFSYYLVSQNLKIEGTFFAGGTIVLAAVAFLRFGKNQPNEKRL